MEVSPNNNILSQLQCIHEEESILWHVALPLSSSPFYEFLQKNAHYPFAKYNSKEYNNGKNHTREYILQLTENTITNTSKNLTCL